MKYNYIYTLNSNLIKMKKTGILFILLTIVFYSCGTRLTEETIIGDWTVIDLKTDVSNLSSDVIESGREEALSTVYSFRNDKTLIIKSDSYSATGYWRIYPENSILEYAYEMYGQPYKEAYIVEFSSSNAIKWNAIGSDGDQYLKLEKQ